MSQASSPAPSSPSLIAEHYWVEGLLGRGGMGAVYAVSDRRSGQRMALKTLALPKDPELRRRLFDMFRREYRTLSLLAHPSVIQVYDYGIMDSGPFYTMELLGGEDLSKRAPVPWREACGYARDVCSCLALLHARELIHRDVSPRNIRCVDGRAKLIDFGAMVSMGSERSVVGTPPLVPPEALHGRTLDGRSDLYALGGTLYMALTGQYAFPTHDLKHLPHLWDRTPPVPSATCPDIPQDLDALVMRLMAQDMEARPRSAAEVMERLNAIAGLEQAEHALVSSAYLTTPSLVGREAELASLQRRLGNLPQAPSSLCVIAGESGIGRSRLLDAATVEARIEGGTVIRIQARDVPESSNSIAEVLLERVANVGAIESKRPDMSPADGPTLRVAQALRSLASRGPVLVAIDDAHVLDHYSQAMLATLHRSAKRRILTLCTVEEGATLAPALQDRVYEASTLHLRPLSEAQSELLLESVFGRVPGLAAVAAHLHGRSHGNPRATLEFAQFLIDGGRIRYDMGRWVLPAKLQHGDLPDAWVEALDLRFAKLDPDALALAEVLAFAVEWTRSPVELDALMREGGSDTELDALVSANIFRVDGVQYGFATDALSERLRSRTSEDRRAKIHGRLATWLRSIDYDMIGVAQCEMHALQPGRAIDSLLAELARGTRWDTAPPDYAYILARAMDACVALDRPRRDRFALLLELIRVGEQMGVPNMPAHFAEVLGQLRVDGVLDAYEALPSSLDAGDRLGQAFQATQARYDALPEKLRVLTPVEGIESLAKVARQAGAFAAITVDYGLLQSLPSLEPFAALSPAIASAVTGTMPGCAHVIAARYEQACECYQSTLARLTEPDHAGLDDDYWRWACNALNYVLGILYGGLGMDAALEHARQLEDDPDWVVPAWDVRRGYCLRLGQYSLAESCRTRMERAVLERGRPAPITNGSARTELYAVAHAGDLPAVRLAVERIEAQIEVHPGYVPYRSYGAAVIDLLCARYEDALAKAEVALAMVRAGEHDSWPWTAGCLLEALLGLGRNHEARERGLQFVAEAERIGLQIMSCHVRIPLAYAEVRLGNHDAGVALIDDVLARYDALGCRGLNSGWAYEHRARIALEMDDRGAFSAAAARCAQEYGHGKSGGSLVARYERLRTDAQRAGMETPSMLPAAPTAELDATTYARLRGETASERQRDALELLLRSCGAVGGQVFLEVEDEFQLWLSEMGTLEVPSPDTPEGLESVGPFATAPGDEASSDAMLTVLVNRRGSSALPATAASNDADDDRFDDDDGDFDTATAFGLSLGRWVAMPLGYRTGDDGFVQVGTAVLYLPGPAPNVAREFVEAISRALVGAELVARA